MNKFLFTLKIKMSGNHRVRHLKNALIDDVDLIKYRIDGMRDKKSNKTIIESTADIKDDNKPLKIAFIVTENGTGASAGDYFTALEFGESLKKFGCEICFLSRKGSNYWYEIDNDVDVLISLLDIYDPRRIRSRNKSLIKIAWPRNWFDRWISNPGFSSYDIVLAPSKISCDYIRKNTGIEPFLMPLATNSTRFNEQTECFKEYLCDYCFTGSFWKYPRDIEEILDPDSMPYAFKLYGKNWENNDKFKKYYQGFISYTDLPRVYASTKIVVDDANNATKKYGSVNSRIYDAIASGTLVVTNGVLGVKEMFNDELPVYNNKKELNHLIEYYMSNEDERRSKVDELQRLILEKHTYDNRARTLIKILNQEYID